MGKEIITSPENSTVLLYDPGSRVLLHYALRVNFSQLIQSAVLFRDGIEGQGRTGFSIPYLAPGKKMHTFRQTRDASLIY
jgi:hypothetical protein